MGCWAGLLLVLAVAANDNELSDSVKPKKMAGIETARLYGNLNKYAYYYTDIMIGAPKPQLTSVIIDTGSRLLGFPCRNCVHCGKHMDPAFDVARSASARWLHCPANCSNADRCHSGVCTYEETYSEGSSIAGFWFDDVIQLGGAKSRNAPIHAKLGCHVKENRLFYSQRANGIMGLAPTSSPLNGASTTVLQEWFKDDEHVRANVFGICLATWGGRLTIGGYDPSYNKPNASSPGVVRGHHVAVAVASCRVQFARMRRVDDVTTPHGISCCGASYAIRRRRESR